MGLPVLNRLLEPLEFSESQEAEYRPRPFVDLAEGYPVPEDLIPKHSQVQSRVPFMTLVSFFVTCSGAVAISPCCDVCGVTSARHWVIGSLSIRCSGVDLVVWLVQFGYINI